MLSPTLSSTQGLSVKQPLRIYIPLPGQDLSAALPEPTAREKVIEATPVFTTMGWDTVYAVPVPEVNKHFTKSGLYPRNYSATVTGALFSTTISGDTGAWQITTGGSGAIIEMAVPITSGTMQAGTSTFDLAGTELTVQVTMTYLPQPNQGTAGTPNELQVNASASSATGHAALVTSISIPGQTDTTVISAAQSAFQKFFDENVTLISYIFSTVSLNAVADDGAFQWLLPTYTSYAYYDAKNIENAVFAVLCMVDENDGGTNTNQLSPGAIPDGAEAGFSISSQIMMKEMILPIMPAAFAAGNKATIDDSYFTLAANDTQILNTKNIQMEKVEYGGIQYTPKCTKFKATMEATELQIYTLVHVDISAGIDAYVEQTAYFTLQLTLDESGNQYLDFVESAPADNRQWTDVAEWITITAVIVGIIGAIAGIIIGAVGQTAKAIIAAIIVAVVFGLAAAVPALIDTVTADGVIGNLPAIDALVLSATAPIAWTGGDAFQVTLAQINGALQLGGVAFPSG